jgi:hypothetical protein
MYGALRQMHPKGEGAANRQLPHQAPPKKNRNLKDTDFVNMVISKVLGDLPTGRNQLLKLAEE